MSSIQMRLSTTKINQPDSEETLEEEIENEESLEAEEAERPPSLREKHRTPKVFDPLSKHILLLLIPASTFGALTRLGLDALATYDGNAIFPLAYPQAVGCLVMGFALGLKTEFGFYPPLYTAITTGFCGSVTTFSSWQLDVFNSWVNSGSYHHAGLRNFIDGLGKTTFTLALALASVAFGEFLAQRCRPVFKDIQPPGFVIRYVVSIASILTYVAILLTYFFLSPSFRHQATAALLFAYPGALSRYLLSISLNTKSKIIPLGTFAANSIGTALLAGFAVAQNRTYPITPNACSILQGMKDGYCGCLTTVSTFAVELRGIRLRRASLYGVLSWGVGQLLMVLILGSSLWTGYAQKEQTCRFSGT